MPTYSYECKACESDFSLRRRLSRRNDPAECPECGSDRTKRSWSGFTVHTGRSSSPSSAPT